MALLSWIILGAIVGLLASSLLGGRFPGGTLGSIVGGTLGAVLGGLVFSVALGRGVTGFDLLSLLIAFAGAALLLGVLRRAGGGPEPTVR